MDIHPSSGLAISLQMERFGVINRAKSSCGKPAAPVADPGIFFLDMISVHRELDSPVAAYQP
jgi:hypothetical protein